MIEENGNKFAGIAVGILIFILFIGVVMVLVNFGSNTANDGIDNLVSTVSSLELKQYDTYNNRIVKGSTVVTAVRNYNTQQFAIRVVTGSDTSGTVYGCALTGFSSLDAATGFYTSTSLDLTSTDTNLSNIVNKGAAQFINTTANFQSNLIVDGNGQVVGINFEQQ